MSIVSGELSREVLLSQMNPTLHKEHYVFVTVEESQVLDIQSSAIAMFREAEGVTLVIPKAIANERALSYEFVSRLITLEVHSSLQAVGFLEPICSVLAKAGISVNVFSAFYHDHLFVAVENAEEALACIRKLSQAVREGEVF
jgi:hypothetical protein